MQYYNVHSHTFTMRNAPEKFLHLYLPGFLADAVDKITETQAGSLAIEKLLKLVGGNGGKRYASFLQIGKSTGQPVVFKKLMDAYPEDRNIRFVGLTMDMEHCGAGSSVSGYEGQLQEILEVKRAYPDNLLLFLGIDPRWKATGTELLDTVKKYFETRLRVNETRLVNPFVGIKIYPSMGFYPFDERLMKTFEWAAENGVPVLSHCSYLGGIFNNNEAEIDAVLSWPDVYNGNQVYPAGGIQYEKQKGFWKWIFGRQKSTNNLNKCSWLMEPAAFETLLRHFTSKGTPLKLCLAHFGGGNQVKSFLQGDRADEEEKNPYGVLRKNWFEQTRDMMSRFPGLYTDVAYALADTTIHDQLIKEIGNPVYGDRVMFGTDFFLTEREGPEYETHVAFKKAAMSAGTVNGVTVWDRAAGTNIETFLKSRFYDGNVI